jgi:phosphoserine phosphatase
MFIATLIAEGLSSGQLDAAADRLAAVDCAPGGWRWLDEGAAADLPFMHHPDAARAALEGAVAGADVIVQVEAHRAKKLLVADMDSTMITVECIDELADYAGIKPQIAEVTERAMRGELDFKASLRERVGTLAGADANILMQVRDALPLMPGLTTLVQKLHALGWQVAIASGGFTFYADYLRQTLHLAAAVANELEIRDGKLTGQVLGQIVDAQFKADTLNDLAQRFEIAPEQTVAIGDGANDLPMIKTAALGIAYHAKPKVNEQTEIIIRHADLMGVFCILTGSLIHEER